MYVYMYTWMSENMYVCMYLCMYVCNISPLHQLCISHSNVVCIYIWRYKWIYKFMYCTYVCMCMYVCTVYAIIQWMNDEMIRRTNGLAWCRRTLLPKLRSLSSPQSSLPLSNPSPYSSSPSARDDPSRSYSTTRSPGRTLRRERCRCIDHLPAPLHQCTVFGACKTEN